MLISTELSLIDERSESTPTSQAYIRDLNENFEVMNTPTVGPAQDGDGNVLVDGR